MASKLRREPVTFRISPDGLDWLNQLAKEYGIDRAEVVRCCVQVAAKNLHPLTVLLKAKQEGL